MHTLSDLERIAELEAQLAATEKRRIAHVNTLVVAWFLAGMTAFAYLYTL